MACILFHATTLADGNRFCATCNDFSNFMKVATVLSAATPILYSFYSKDNILWMPCIQISIIFRFTSLISWLCSQILANTFFVRALLKHVACSNQDKNVWLYILLAFVPLTVFHLFSIIFSHFTDYVVV